MSRRSTSICRGTALRSTPSHSRVAARRQPDVSSRLRRSRESAVLEPEACRDSRTRSPRQSLQILGVDPDYAWWPHQRGLVRNTHRCRAPATSSSAFPHGLDIGSATKPYLPFVLRHRAIGRTATSASTSLDAPEFEAASHRRLHQYSRRREPGAAPISSITSPAIPCSSIHAAIGIDRRSYLDDLVAGTSDVALPWGPAGRAITRRSSTRRSSCVPARGRTGRAAVIQHFAWA